MAVSDEGALAGNGLLDVQLAANGLRMNEIATVAVELLVAFELRFAPPSGVNTPVNSMYTTR